MSTKTIEELTDAEIIDTWERIAAEWVPEHPGPVADDIAEHLATGNADRLRGMLINLREHSTEGAGYDYVDEGLDA